ncbi:hypothetical protein NMY22_g7673 [Coprinellus aureogranulatus]|nr:hypothetical protein NMY22_g7673 [Coprinellus aureogranulatus]
MPVLLATQTTPGIENNMSSEDGEEQDDKVDESIVASHLIDGNPARSWNRLGVPTTLTLGPTFGMDAELTDRCASDITNSDNSSISISPRSLDFEDSGYPSVECRHDWVLKSGNALTTNPDNQSLLLGICRIAMSLAFSILKVQQVNSQFPAKRKCTTPFGIPFQMTESRNDCRYDSLPPERFSVGDIVEVCATFTLFPYHSNQNSNIRYRLVFGMRALSLLNNEFSKAMKEANMNRFQRTKDPRRIQKASPKRKFLTSWMPAGSEGGSAENMDVA